MMIQAGRVWKVEILNLIIERTSERDEEIHDEFIEPILEIGLIG